jgi:uncharacterized metal-binding protein YceD (DUF177 family)
LQAQKIFEMKHSKEYSIPFKGLKLGKHQFKYLVEKKFFDAYQYDDFLDSNVEVILNFVKKNTLFELQFTVSGTVLVNCDVSGEEYNQPINGELDLIVKFGNEFNNDNEEILIIPHNEYELDVSQYIYELIVLSVPIKRIHPQVVDGTLKSKALDKLVKMQNKADNKQIDPRWDKLKELIKDKKS